jgi:hypothetical protein
MTNQAEEFAREESITFSVFFYSLLEFDAARMQTLLVKVVYSGRKDNLSYFVKNILLCKRKRKLHCQK